MTESTKNNSIVKHVLNKNDILVVKNRLLEQYNSRLYVLVCTENATSVLGVFTTSEKATNYMLQLIINECYNSYVINNTYHCNYNEDNDTDSESDSEACTTRYGVNQTSEVTTRYGVSQTSEVTTRYGVNQTSEVTTRYGVNQTSEDHDVSNNAQ